MSAPLPCTRAGAPAAPLGARVPGLPVQGCRDAVRPPQADRPPVRRPGAPDGARRAGLRRPGDRGREPDGWALRRVLDRVGLIQIDSVNVLSRAHYLPLFSRARPVRPELLDRAAHRAPRKLFEYWGHEASLLPVATQPLLRWRMERAGDDAWGGMRRIQQRAAGARRARCSRRSATAGPIAASEVARGGAAGAHRPVVGLVGRQAGVRVAVLERADHLGAAARLRAPLRPARAGAAARGRSRRRRPTLEDAQRELVRIAARALGVAAERDLRDYFRLPVAEARARVAELVEARRAVAGRGRGLERPGLPAPGGAAAALGRRPRAGRAVRLADLGAPARGAAVRLPLPDRDLRPDAQARARLLRAAVPARRPARRARRPQGRPRGRRAARAGRRTPSRTRRRRRRPSSPPSSSRWPAGSGSAAWRCSRGAISPPRWPPPRDALR